MEPSNKTWRRDDPREYAENGKIWNMRIIVVTGDQAIRVDVWLDEWKTTAYMSGSPQLPPSLEAIEAGEPWPGFAWTPWPYDAYEE